MLISSSREKKRVPLFDRCLLISVVGRDKYTSAPRASRSKEESNDVFVSDFFYSCKLKIKIQVGSLKNQTNFKKLQFPFLLQKQQKNSLSSLNALNKRTLLNTDS